MEALYNLINEDRRLIAAAVLVVLLTWESLSPFFSFFTAQGRNRITHGLTNVALGLLNSILIIGVFVGLWAWAAERTFAEGWGILNLMSLPTWLKAICAVLLFDLWTYWFHRWHHEIPFFWRFHRVHHSDFEMDVTTGNRFHFGETFFSSLARLMLIPIYGAELWHLALYETLMFPVVQFHHSNISLPAGADRLLRAIIVTPFMHKVHHSKIQAETDSNYTSLFSFWDRLFGTYRVRTDPENIDLGLHGYDARADQRIDQLLVEPGKGKREEEGEAGNA